MGVGIFQYKGLTDLSSVLHNLSWCSFTTIQDSVRGRQSQLISEANLPVFYQAIVQA